MNREYLCQINYRVHGFPVVWPDYLQAIPYGAK